MTTVSDILSEHLTTHLDLPETDRLLVENTYQPEQSRILIQSIRPWLIERIQPDGPFLVAGDHKIYFRYTNPPLDGCSAPDWLYVPSSPPDHWYHRSYCLVARTSKIQRLLEKMRAAGLDPNGESP